MKCLSVQEPWAWALMFGPKRYENRSWFTSYRGPLAIHVSKGRDFLRVWEHDAGLRKLLEGYDPEQSRFGHVIGVMELDLILPGAQLLDHLGELDPDGQAPFINAEAYAWRLTNPEPFDEPVAYRGKQGLFWIPDLILPELV